MTYSKLGNARRKINFSYLVASCFALSRLNELSSFLGSSSRWCRCCLCMWLPRRYFLASIRPRNLECELYWDNLCFFLYIKCFIKGIFWTTSYENFVEVVKVLINKNQTLRKELKTYAERIEVIQHQVLFLWPRNRVWSLDLLKYPHPL